MSLTKSKGNMYNWCTHTHTHLGGECSHRCKYCYVQAMAKRFGHDRYKGPVRLIEKEFNVNYGSGRTIFIEHCNDLFATGVEVDWILRILEHCCKYPDNTYVFQTKNPERMIEFLPLMPKDRILGCTIETDIPSVSASVSDAPLPSYRFANMFDLSYIKEQTFITVEPILKMNPYTFAESIAKVNPGFVNIGADSKGTGLEEPTASEIAILIKELEIHSVTINRKTNLSRILGK